VKAAFKETLKTRAIIPVEGERFGGPYARLRSALHEDAVNLIEEIACFAAVIAAAEIFLVAEEGEPVLASVRSSLP
jgi:hypothetical protein